MSGAHTPGQWRRGIADDGYFIATGALIPDVAQRITSAADAALIEAAPEMLAALVSLLNRYVEMANSGDCGFWEPEREQQVLDARAAIAKATGEKA